MDALWYNGMRVRKLWDVRATNGESFTGGNFRGVVTMRTFETGRIMVEAIRDYAILNEKGEGKLIGLRYSFIAE